MDVAERMGSQGQSEGDVRREGKQGPMRGDLVPLILDYRTVSWEMLPSPFCKHNGLNGITGWQGGEEGQLWL